MLVGEDAILAEKGVLRGSAGGAADCYVMQVIQRKDSAGSWHVYRHHNFGCCASFAKGWKG